MIRDRGSTIFRKYGYEGLTKGLPLSCFTSAIFGLYIVNVIVQK